MRVKQFIQSSVAVAAAMMVYGTALAQAVTTAAVTAPAPVAAAITDADLQAANERWCSALLDVSASYDAKGYEAAKESANKLLDELYGYQMGVVLFKPTLTVVPNTFRTTKEGALSYFVGGNPAYSSDKGFATKSWKKCEVATAASLITGGTASTLGKVRLTNKDDQVVTVDKTMQFVRDAQGNLRIVGHHSSLEYEPSAKAK